MIYTFYAGIGPAENEDGGLFVRYGGEGRGPDFDGRSLRNEWKGLPYYTSSDGGEAYNFLGYTPSTFLCDDKAKAVIAPYLVGKVEFLPFDIGINKPYYLVNVTNVTNVIDALDMEQSEVVYFPHNGKFRGIRKYVFHHHKLEHEMLFKLPVNAKFEILCTEQFKSLIEEAGLVGLKFFRMDEEGE